MPFPHSPLQGGSAGERMTAAGGVQQNLVDAFRAVLTDPHLDGTFKAMAISLPSDAELIDAVPDEADPVAIHEVRWRC